MTRKLSIVLLTLITVCCVCFGCTKTQIEDRRTVKGLEVAETLNVNFGDEVALEELNVYEEETNTYLEVYTLVENSVGGYVDASDGCFIATDVGGYTIEYLVCDTNNYNHSAKTSVVVNAPSSADEISVSYNSVVEINTPLKIRAVCGDENATLLYSVSLLDGDNVVSEVDVDSDGNYTLTQTGKYLAEVCVQGNENAYESYEFVARAPMIEGEVEVYDDTWALVQDVTGDTRKMEVVTTTGTGIKDRFGRDGSFAKVVVNPALNNVPIYVMPRGDEAYYESLLASGYTTVSLWVYIECENSHTAVIRRDPNGWNPYQSETDVLPVCHPNTWTEIPINLGRTEEPLYKSFVEFLRYYELGMNIVEFANDEYNIDKDGNLWGRDSEMTIYIDAVYANKGEETIAVSENFSKEYKVGDTIDLDGFCEEAGEYWYSYVFNGRKTNVEGTTLSFTTNGTYTIIAQPKTPNRAGKASLDVTVSDDFADSLAYTYKAYERTGDSVNIPFSDFGVSFTAVEGIVPTVTGYTVSYNGAEVSATATEFTAKKDGMYEVLVTASYEKNGQTCYTIVSLVTDVYSQATQFEVLDLDNMVAGVSDKQDKQAQNEYPTVEILENITIGGQKGTYYYVDRNGYTATLYAKSRYSTQYYEQLLAKYGECDVTLNLYVDGHQNANGSDWVSYYGMFLGSTYYKITEYEWVQKTLTLTEYLETYYARAKSWYQGAQEAYDSDTMYAYGQTCKAEVSNWTSFILLYSYANTQGASDFYFNVSLAPQNAEVEISSNFAKEYSVGQTVDLSAICAETLEEASYSYAYELNGGVLVDVQGDELLLTENGTYILHVYMQLMDGIFENTIEIVATDSFQEQSSYTYKAYERTGDSVEIAFSDLAISLGEYNGSPLAISGYAVTYNGQAVALNNTGTGFTATADGTYTIIARGVYTVSETQYATSVSLVTDVYSQATKFEVLNLDDMVAGYSDKQDKNTAYPTVTKGEYTVGEKTGTYYFVDRSGYTATLYAKSRFSTKYYEWLIDTYGEYDVTFELYADGHQQSNTWLSYYGMFLGSTLYKVTEYEWVQKTITLSTYLETYYARAKTWYQGAQVAYANNTMYDYGQACKAEVSNWTSFVLLHSYANTKGASDFYFNVSLTPQSVA